jgi:hypothetical protein
MSMQSVQKSFAGRRIVLFLLAVLSGVSVTSAFASNITVASPTNGTTTTSPVLVRAHNVGCNGVAPTAFGFSIDNSTTTIWGATAYDIDVAQQAISTGQHTIHFKAWSHGQSCPMVNSVINVTDGSSGSGSSSGQSGSTSSGSTTASIPSNALASADLDTLSNWAGEHDSGTPGSSYGSTAYPATTPVYDDAREFYMTYSSGGGERWHISFAKDSQATHFVMDTYVYVPNPDKLANLELDLNQVIPNGKTVIYGTQCSTYSKSWEWTYYSNGYHWHSSNIPCDPRSWSANTWHHIQVGFHRDSNGVVTHDWVNFDGNQSSFSGATGNAAKPMGWASQTLLMNVQLDGYKSGGSVTTYLHKTTYYRW